MKEIIYWGIGNIGRQCLKQCLDEKPVFLVDRFSSQKEAYGLEVKRPEEIKDWSVYYIVITVKDEEDRKAIEGFLRGKGLCEKKDYIGYEDFFSCRVPSVKESITSVQAYKAQNREEISPIMLVTPITRMRNRDSYFSFLSEYVKKRAPRKLVVFSHLEMMSSAKVSEKLGCTVFEIPDICSWNGQQTEHCLYLADTVQLSKEEERWIGELEQRKKISDNKDAFRYSKEIYCYYKTIIEVLNPAGVIVWGSWMRENYIVGHVAEVGKIPCGYMEHGWIPGTNQFDFMGMAGEGEYAVNPEALDEINVDENDVRALQSVKQYVIENQLDTRAFQETEADRAELDKLDPSKKTVLLVGMDEKGMAMNPRNEYWRRHISDVYSSVEEVLADLMEICGQNDYNLIFRPHPGRQELDINRIARDRIIYAKDISIDCLIKVCDVAVSIASAVDYKVLMYGRPLVQVGITGLRGKGCTYEVKNRADIGYEVEKAIQGGMTETQKRKYDVFLARLLKRYLWNDMSPKPVIYGQSLDIDFFERIRK